MNLLLNSPAPAANTPVDLVSVVIATIGRPAMLRDAVRSIMAQDHEGAIEVLVVFDGIEIDPLEDIDVPANRHLRLMRNLRTKGLAGGRNTGILAAAGDVVGFCDDDDLWHPTKLGMQLDLWSRHPQATAISSGITVRSADGETDRCPPSQTSFRDFLHSRVTAIHPSTMLFRWEDLMGRVGLVDEELPSSYGEDYDLLLRVARFGDVWSVPVPLVTVRWDRPSFFAGNWRNMAGGLTYILRKFPELEDSPHGTARIAGQVAFCHAALGERRTAVHWAYSALRRNPHQLRAYAALAVASGVVAPERLLAAVNRTGHGL